MEVLDNSSLKLFIAAAAETHRRKVAICQAAIDWKKARSKDPIDWKELGKAEASLSEAIGDLE